MQSEESRERIRAMRQKMAAEAQALSGAAEDEFERRVFGEVRGIAVLLTELKHVSTWRLHAGLLLVQYVGAKVSPCLYLDHSVVRALDGKADWLRVLDSLEDVDPFIRSNLELPQGGEVVTMARPEKRILVRAS